MRLSNSQPVNYLTRVFVTNRLLRSFYGLVVFFLFLDGILQCYCLRSHMIYIDSDVSGLFTRVSQISSGWRVQNVKLGLTSASRRNGCSMGTSCASRCVNSISLARKLTTYKYCASYTIYQFSMAQQSVSLSG